MHKPILREPKKERKKNSNKKKLKKGKFGQKIKKERKYCLQGYIEEKSDVFDMFFSGQKSTKKSPKKPFLANFTRNFLFENHYGNPKLTLEC